MGRRIFCISCDAALLLTGIGMWLESPLLISMCAVGILLPQILWLGGFWHDAAGVPAHRDMTGYMFDDKASAFSPLPFTTLSRLAAAGSHLAPDRASAMTAEPCLAGRFWPPGWFSSAIFLCLPPEHTRQPKPAQVNINYVYGFNDHEPQHWMNQNVFVIVGFSALWLVAFTLPTHLLLRRIFPVMPPLNSDK